jgi:dipeptidyl aminopeptidase/acylaminoacyl peptidase
MRPGSGIALLAALLLTPPAAVAGPGAPGVTAPQTRPPLVPTGAFTARSGLSGMKLSPDGNRIALKILASDGKSQLAVFDANTKRVIHKLDIPPIKKLEWIRWAGNGRIVVSLSQLGRIYGADVPYTRVFVYDLTTGNFSFVGKQDMGVVGDNVLHIDPAGQFLLLSVQRAIRDWPSVWRFPLDGTAQQSGQQVQAPRKHVGAWYTDDQGVVRMALEELGDGNSRLIYRRHAAEDFRVAAVFNRKGGDQRGQWTLAQIAAGSDEGHVLEQDASGHTVLRKVNFATGTTGATVFARAGSDIDDVWIDEDNQLVAAYWTDDRDRVEWFDPEMKALQAQLDKTLAGNQVRLSARSRDRSRLLVWAEGENDPGRWYIYTPAAQKLDLFFAEKPAIDPAQMAVATIISYKTRDGVEIKALLTLPPRRAPKNLPLIVLPHGGPYGVHDQLTFDTEAQFLANRGYAVLQPNYRGSGGSGDDFVKLGEGQIGRKMQDDLDDGMDWAVAQGYADPGRVCLVGTSYGGYAALWGVIRNPERYRCAASFAGVTDWTAQLRYDRNFFSRTSGRKWKQKISGSQPGFSLDDVSPVKQIGRLTRPVLLVHGERDTRVQFKQFTALKLAAGAAGKPLELLTFPDESHGFDKAANEAKWLDTLEAFLRRHNPVD